MLVHGATLPYVAFMAARLGAMTRLVDDGAAGGPVIVVAPDESVARTIENDLTAMGAEPVALPPSDASPYAELAPDRTDAACYVWRMALLAQQGRTRLEHCRNRAAVRVVTD